MMSSTPDFAATTTGSASFNRRDPILVELWEIKAKMNAEAGYDVGRLLENAHKEVQALRDAGVLLRRASDA